MKIPGIYQIQSKLRPDKVYIGSALNIQNRWRSHLSNLRKNIHHSSKLQAHFNKYGIGDLQFSVLLGCNKEDLIKTEQYFIDSYKPQFNICPIAGSQLGRKWKNKKGRKASDETKRILSESKKGRKLTEEHKAKISLNNRQRGVKKINSAEARRKMSISHIGLQSGENHPLFGRHHSDESKAKISIAFKGKKLSDETKRKMSISKTGVKHKAMSEQGRKNISLAQKGRIPWNKGLKKVI